MKFMNMKLMSMSNLSKGAQELLNHLIEDYSSKLSPEERVLKLEAAPNYLYNLFTANSPEWLKDVRYKFSLEQFTELFYFLGSSTPNKDIIKEPEEITLGLYQTKIATKETFRVTRIDVIETKKESHKSYWGIWSNSPQLTQCPIDKGRLDKRISD